jgi:hypothetical protein
MASKSDPAPMTGTVFHVWGKLNRTFDARPQPEGLLDYFDQYVKWTDPAAPDRLQVYLDAPGLVNGYYNVWIEGSMSAATPGLVSLFGLDQYDDGGAKFMGISLRDTSNRPVPIQTVGSKIDGLAGPEAPPPAGLPAVFSWETLGYGEQFCYVDGRRIANAADRVHCEAPLNLKVADGLNHTLSVVLLDVCGQTTANGVIFGSWGWAADPKYAPPPVPVPAVDAAAAVVALPAAAELPRVARSRTAATSGAGDVGAALGLFMTAFATGLGALLASWMF